MARPSPARQPWPGRPRSPLTSLTSRWSLQRLEKFESRFVVNTIILTRLEEEEIQEKKEETSPAIENSHI